MEKATYVETFTYIKNYYFDVDEFEKSPVKSYLDYYAHKLKGDLAQRMFFTMEKHTVRMEDSWLGLPNSGEKEVFFKPNYV